VVKAILRNNVVRDDGVRQALMDFDADPFAVRFFGSMRVSLIAAVMPNFESL
jgi:hypothetical protein